MTKPAQNPKFRRLRETFTTCVFIFATVLVHTNKHKLCLDSDVSGDRGSGNETDFVLRFLTAMPSSPIITEFGLQQHSDWLSDRSESFTGLSDLSACCTATRSACRLQADTGRVICVDVGMERSFTLSTGLRLAFKEAPPPSPLPLHSAFPS